MNVFKHQFIGLAVFGISCLLPQYSSAATPNFKKVMLIVLENTDYQEALKQPFLSKLVSQGALFTNFLAEAHPSQPNYIAMIAGDTLGVKGDANINLNGNHIGDLLEQKGKTWKVYAEDFPGNCFTGATSGKYARKHVPFLSFKNIQSNPDRCSNIVEASALDADSNGALPDFSLYIPNLDNDGHDTGASNADQWLAQAFGPKIADPQFMQDLLLIITFDESESHKAPNKIFTVFVGPSVIPGSLVSAETSHYSILRTIEDSLGLGSLGRNDASSSAIEGIWR